MTVTFARLRLASPAVPSRDPTIYNVGTQYNRAIPVCCGRHLSDPGAVDSGFGGLTRVGRSRRSGEVPPLGSREPGQWVFDIVAAGAGRDQRDPFRARHFVDGGPAVRLPESRRQGSGRSPLGDRSRREGSAGSRSYRGPDTPDRHG